jgi:hypothetical protein
MPLSSNEIRLSNANRRHIAIRPEILASHCARSENRKRWPRIAHQPPQHNATTQETCCPAFRRAPFAVNAEYVSLQTTLCDFPRETPHNAAGLLATSSNAANADA